MSGREPHWQSVQVGDQVRCFGVHAIGTVIEIVETQEGVEGVTTRVKVRWRRTWRPVEVWPTDFLTIIGKQEEVQ